MLKTLIIATVLLPTFAFAQRSQQQPQPRQPGQWCPEGSRLSSSVLGFKIAFSPAEWVGYQMMDRVLKTRWKRRLVLRYF